MSKLPLWAQLLIIVSLSLVLGVGGLWLSTILPDPFKSIMINLAAIIITASLFSWWGAYQARIEITRYLSKNFQLSENIKTAGICSVGI